MLSVKTLPKSDSSILICALAARRCSGAAGSSADVGDKENIVLCCTGLLSHCPVNVRLYCWSED